MRKRIESTPLVKKIAFFFPLCIVAVLSLLNVSLSGQLVNQGKRIQDLEGKAYTLNLQEKDLESMLAGKQSLQKISDEALAQGYLPISSISYIGDARPVALR